MCVKSDMSETNDRLGTAYKYLSYSVNNQVDYLSFVFQIRRFIGPQVQKNSKPIYLLMSISCKINVISLKLKKIARFNKSLLRLHILAS